VAKSIKANAKVIRIPFSVDQCLFVEAKPKSCQSLVSIESMQCSQIESEFPRDACSCNMIQDSYILAHRNRAPQELHRFAAQNGIDESTGMTEDVDDPLVRERTSPYSDIPRLFDALPNG